MSYLLMKFAHIEADKSEKSAFISCKFAGAIALLVTSSIIHVVMLPFLPMILMAMNSATAIVIGAMLAVIFLKEQILWCYDMTAFLLISAGCTGIVLLSKSSEIAMTTEIVTEQLTSISTIVFSLLFIICIVLDYMLDGWFNG